ncbi:hypothetical protein Brms1b_003906 [Colletotrichum noveboracense]|nr:hypothetical protein CBS470a_007791 [Colletotrichum nupharicola]KAJ0282856.1 hypothetical protein COL940_004986 [Colletotrichum noveboracense]KAJ0319211.1 hypothetical protein Brms1b_003906 [Colletotrichum noveboracense]
MPSVWRTNSLPIEDKVHSMAPPHTAAILPTSSAITVFGEGLGFLQQPTWEPNFKEAVYTMFHLIHIMRHFPWTTGVMEMIPVWVIKPLSAKIGLLMETVKIKLPELVRQTKARHENGIKRDRVTVLHSLLESDLPPEELTVKRLAGEANVFLSAGTETTASALTICTYHLLRNPDAVAKIRAELATVNADPKELPSWATLKASHISTLS